ncbi:aromatic ring-hydroxylating dioxygenase subunit alpha [Parasedimentitalea maritima]|uniref:Aromatic ring-hydroxylating dioxygenase subunit alpha n=1 Tax=Parasedimentitalea maritima TaxID=2578117 RepID=A0ABY2UXJ3_9RHOB|nr:aromatic ring-hydroxylating dioxygenase subunit alpha [Zongyanglinia marina]TLP64562.1 aromatic ring-hydroxylating dioxygenase subunit alpha [Zongyanglinia marina]
MPVTDLSPVNLPIQQAQGLPNAHYNDAAVFTEEKQALLLTQWSGLAVAADVAEPGDAVPVTFMDIPLLLIRDRQGTVRVFQNTCRHRGMILVEAPRKIEGAIRCPYHSWCYSTEGKLVSTPHVGGPGQNTHDGIDRALLGLIEVRSHIWRDVVWINISGDAPPFDAAMKDVISRWAEFDVPLFHGGEDSRFQLKLDCNWKLAVENYCESYHLPWVHPGLNSYSRLEDHYHIEHPGSFSGQGTLVYRQIQASDGTRFPDFVGLNDAWDKAAEYIAVYPNVLMGVHRDHAFVIVLLPDGPAKTIENIHIYYAADQSDAALRARNTAQWKEVFAEDVFVVEGMQRGRNAPGFDGGRFSPAMDGPTHLFHSWVAEQVQIHRTQTKLSE